MRCADEARASEMEHAIRHEIHVRLDENPAFYESLREKLQKIIEDRAAMGEEFEGLQDLVLEPLASAEAVISTEEKELGILLIDLGGGRNRLGGSALAQVYSQLGDVAPDLDDPARLKAFFVWPASWPPACWALSFASATFVTFSPRLSMLTVM